LEGRERIKFSFGEPVGRKYLFDREAELDALDHCESCFLTGPLGAGKTSLAKSHIEKTGCSAVWIRGEKISGSRSLVSAIIREVLKAKERSEHKDEYKAVEIEIENYRDGKIDVYTFITRLFESVERMEICFIFDEYPELRRIGPLFNHLNRVIFASTKRRSLRIILTSSELGYTKFLLERKDLPLGLYVKEVKVLPFREEKSIEFIALGMEKYGHECPKKSYSRIYPVTEGFPLWLSLVGQRMLEGKCNVDGIYDDERAQAFWIKRLISLSEKERLMLRYIAQGRKFTEIGPHSRRVLTSLYMKGYVSSMKEIKIVDPVLNALLQLSKI
jgi:hypothetical protein